MNEQHICMAVHIYICVQQSSLKHIMIKKHTHVLSKQHNDTWKDR